MRYVVLLLALLLAGCPSEPAANAVPEPVKPVMENKVVVLYYNHQTAKEKEEKRLDDLLQKGWRVVSTETRSEADQVGQVGRVEWTVTVTLEREKP